MVLQCSYPLINTPINNALRMVYGCLRATPADNLPILAGIQSAELRRKGATLCLARRAMEPGHLLHSAPTHASSRDAQCLKSCDTFVPAAHQLIILWCKINICVALWADHQWNAEWADNLTRLRIFIPDTSSRSPERPFQ